VVAVAGDAQIACDAEQVVERSPDIWGSLLGDDGFTLAQLIATRSSASFDNAATRVWTARECLTKIGAPPGSPLVLERFSANGAVLLASGSRRIATLEVLQETVRIFAFLACEPTNFATS
jgi:enediyne polyketide synthase